MEERRKGLCERVSGREEKMVVLVSGRREKSYIFRGEENRVVLEEERRKELC